MTSDPLYQTLPNPLRQKVLQMVQKYPDTLDVINEIIMHYTPELVHKKQKKDLSTIGSLIYTLPDFSFISPIRKKVSLKLHQTGLSLADLSIPYVDIDRILCFETPNKSKLNWTVVIKTKSTSHLMNSNTIIFSFDDVIKGFKITHIGDNFKLTNRIPKQLLFEAFSKTMHKLNVVEPDPLFVSKSKSKFIDCYNRAKDGVLVFFEDSLFFGLKKPLMYFDREMIQNIQIVGITNRTFNIHLELKANDNDKEYDLDLVEFSLIDLVEMEFVESFIRRFLKQSNELSSNKIKSKMETGDATNLAADVILSEDDEDYISGQDIDDVTLLFKRKRLQKSLTRTIIQVPKKLKKMKMKKDQLVSLL
ncbi:hypothetical protein BC833DRAFT_591136 [Globomyces pollinis-pini]|nr:hypothetical protein BC833DRAFT_591136 [Globomyces pollinis-pini]